MVKNRNLLIGACLFIATALVVFSACESDSDADNPYDDVNYGNGNGNGQNLDPTSFAGIHEQILLPKCANPGCHDGTFEPDYRTVQSSYSTLVYQTVSKRTVDSVNYFDFRVIPFDAPNSFLMERLTTPTYDYMPSNAVRLSQQEITNIETWIGNGAKDIHGNSPSIPALPNEQPVVNFFVPFYGALQIDTSRIDGLFQNPFTVTDTITMDLYFALSDDSTQIHNLINNQVKISDDINDFSNAMVYTPVSLYYGGILWTASVNTSAFTVGKQYYIRYYTNDGDHVDDLEYPNDDTPTFIKSNFSFLVVN